MPSNTYASMSLSVVASLAVASCTEPADESESVPQQREHDLQRDETPPVIASVRPPALSGGTLLVTRDAAHVVAADPDRDRIVILDVDTHSVMEIPLDAGDEPGRSVEDDAGRVHVALRRGRAVVTVDPTSGAVLARRAVCDAPRGIAFDAAHDRLVVACASGEVVHMAAAPARDTVERRWLEPDLRDVVVVGDQVWVSHLRGSEIVMIGQSGSVVGRERPVGDAVPEPPTPTTAWRMQAMPGGPVAMVHQMARTRSIVLDGPQQPSGDTASYATVGCNEDVLRTVVTFVDRFSEIRTVSPDSMGLLSLPVDLGVSRNGERLALLDAARGMMIEFVIGTLSQHVPCVDDGAVVLDVASTTQPIALAYGELHDLWVQTREPAHIELYRDGTRVDVIDLGGESRADSGYDLFHDIGAVTSSGHACASCHPEGRDDGHVWNFIDIGPRRTQSLAGTVAGTAPFHWSGDHATLDSLMDDTFVARMGGPAQSPERVAALRSWLEHLEPVRLSRAPVDQAAANRGKTLFESAAVGCATCHAGPLFTNNATVSVGTGEYLQVPSLVGVANRLPAMHDGCATTLFDRFDLACGGDDRHGNTSQLTDDEIAALVAYMSTL
jgi:cytochrome c